MGTRKVELIRPCAAHEHLEDKVERFIGPLEIRHKGKGLEGNKEYTITDKGDYYIQMARWDEYI